MSLEQSREKDWRAPNFFGRRCQETIVENGEMRQGRTEASESSLDKAIITEDKWSSDLLGTVGHGGPEWTLCWSGECELVAKRGGQTSSVRESFRPYPEKAIVCF